MKNQSPNKSKPTPNDLLNACNHTVPDVIAPGLRVLFCGINPGLYSGAVRHHFAHPGNRFWPTLHAAGFTPRLLSAYEDKQLLEHGYGITNLVKRVTATAQELSPQELFRGSQRLLDKVRKYQPHTLAILGVTAFRLAFQNPKTTIGQQPATIDATQVWVLPNPSGLNANYQLPDLIKLFQLFRRKIESTS